MKENELSKFLKYQAQQLNDIYGDRVTYPYYSGEKGEKELMTRIKKIKSEIIKTLKKETTLSKTIYERKIL